MFMGRRLGGGGSIRRIWGEVGELGCWREAGEEEAGELAGGRDETSLGE